MFNASSGLFPSAYLPNSVHPEMNQNFVYRTIMEAKRVRNLVKSRKDGNDKPIHLYSRIRYRDNLNFYTKVLYTFFFKFVFLHTKKTIPQQV